MPNKEKNENLAGDSENIAFGFTKPDDTDDRENLDTNNRTSNINTHNMQKDIKDSHTFVNQIISDNKDSKGKKRELPTFEFDDVKPSITTNHSKDDKKSKKSHSNISTSVKTSIFLIAIVIVLISGYKKLLDGITIDSLDISGIKLENVFLKLNDRFDLQIERVSVDNQDDGESSSINDIVSNVKSSLYILSYFNNLMVKDINVNGKHYGSLIYENKQYKIDTPIFNASMAIDDDKDNIHIKIEQFKMKNLPINIAGDLVYVVPRRELLFQIKALKGRETLSLNGMSDFKILRLNGSSSDLNDLEIIRPYIDDLQNQDLKNTLNKWIFDDLKYSSLKINSIRANLSLENLENDLLNKLYVNGVVRNAEVTLNQGVPPINANEVILEFKNSSLSIMPKEAEFANMELINSKVVIADIPNSNVYITINGRNIRLDSNMKKLLKSYHVDVPVIQDLAIRRKSKGSFNQDNINKVISNTESIVLQSINSNKKPDITDPGMLDTISLNDDNLSVESRIESIKSSLSDDSTDENEMQEEEISSESQNKELYNKVLELNPNTTLSNTTIYNTSNTENSSMHLKISIEYDENDALLFSLQGVVQAIDANLKLYDVPLKAKKLNVVLDIEPQQKLIYINASRAKWENMVDSDVNVLVNIDKETIAANTFIHSAIINSSNIENLDFKSSTHKQALNNIIKNHGIYLGEDLYAFNPQSTSINDLIKNVSYENSFNDDVKALKSSRKIEEISKEELKKLPKEDIKDNGQRAKQDSAVLKALPNNPIWNELKLRSKKTRPFTPLNRKQLEQLAKEQIEEDSKFDIKQDFLNVKNENMKLNISFGGDKVVLDVPTIGVYLESSDRLQLSIPKIENILKYSPIAQYYGITSGSLRLKVPYISEGSKDDTILFTLNLYKLQYPIYTFENKRLDSLTITGRFGDDTLLVLAGDKIDFKSKDSLNMLRVSGYRINIDEALKSKIPFLVELFGDEKDDKLPYSFKAIRQEQKLIEIKNQIRRVMKIKPFDFNILAKDMQFTFMGYTVPFDYANIRLIDNKINMDAQYEKGIMNLSMIKDNVLIVARNFSGNFINTIITSSKGGKNIVSGGTFNIDALYRGGILNASIEVRNTAVIELKAVQNIFAFIDAIPSLIMFRNPNAGQNGYEINLGKIMFTLNDDYIGLENIFLLGKIMDVSGQGIIDIDTGEINVNLGISTVKSLSRFISKIPIIGYLILGKEGQINTNLILSGKYSNPKVNITLVEDIIKAPFLILRRIFPPQSVDMEEADF